MGYKKIKIADIVCESESAFKILLNLGYDVPQAQKLIDKKRLFYGKNGEFLVNAKNKKINGEIFLVDYICESKGLEPIFQTDDFAVFDKPSGILSHPNGRNSGYNLCDEIWNLYGKNACVAHRLDRETSGVIIVCKNKFISKDFKKMFENREISKQYFALVHGKISDNFTVDENIGKSENFSDIKIRMKINKNAKRAVTKFFPVKFYPKLNATLLKIYPLTGRQHQIRLHLFHVKHSIFGEPLYGIEKEIVEKIMDKNLSLDERIFYTTAKRLCLHASKIEFNYKGENFCIETKTDFEKAFLESLK